MIESSRRPQRNEKPPEIHLVYSAIVFFVSRISDSLLVLYKITKTIQPITTKTIVINTNLQ